MTRENGLRVTPAIRVVLAAIVEAPPGDPPWGFTLCEQTGLGPGRVYPALDKLLTAGWITARWESSSRRPAEALLL